MAGRGRPRVVGRRRFLELSGAVLTVSLAGCTETIRRASEAGPEVTTASDELDLREANVVGVEYERDGNSYTFSVTLVHDDDGEDGYANWWQVETLDGKRLGRRELAHPHGTREFTRSERVEIPPGTTSVVVRGHDQTHEYGGQAMIVDLETGDARAIRQGPDPRSFETTTSS